MLFFRQLQHLLPRAHAWRLTVSKTLRSYFEGLAELPSDVRDFIDDVYGDIFPETTRELARWESQYGLPSDGTEAARRLQLSAAMKATGGQSPRYLQDVMQTAGFPVYVHEWWEPATVPRVARNPLDYTDQPLVGTARCGTFASNARCKPLSPPGAFEVARCNRFLVNDVHYIVNLNLTRVAPPAIPEDTATWRYFLYFGGQTFGDRALILASRRAEFERLLLKICPAQQWLVTLVDYVQIVTDESGAIVTDESGIVVVA